MIVKVYWSIWALVLLLAAVLFVAGQFTDVTVVFFGFVVFGLVFMGMMSVLPAGIIHSEPHQR
jgi:ABC-type branched-subunit amino acid transport system permease subunit